MKISSQYYFQLIRFSKFSECPPSSIKDGSLCVRAKYGNCRASGTVQYTQDSRSQRNNRFSNMVSSTRSLTNLLPHNLGHENTDGTERSNAATSIGMSYSRPPLSNPNQDSYMLDCGSPYVISQCHGVQQCSSFCDDKSIDQYRYSCSVRKVPSQRPMSMRNARKYSKMRQRVKQDHKYSNKIGIFSCNNYVWKSGISREATDVKDGDVVASTYSSDMCDADISNMSADDDYENDSESHFSSKSDCSVVGSSPCLNDVSSCNSRTNDSGAMNSSPNSSRYSPIELSPRCINTRVERNDSGSSRDQCQQIAVCERNCGMNNSQSISAESRQDIFTANSVVENDQQTTITNLDVTIGETEKNPKFFPSCRCHNVSCNFLNPSQNRNVSCSLLVPPRQHPNVPCHCRNISCSSLCSLNAFHLPQVHRISTKYKTNIHNNASSIKRPSSQESSTTEHYVQFTRNLSGHRRLLDPAFDVECRDGCLGINLSLNPILNPSLDDECRDSCFDCNLSLSRLSLAHSSSNNSSTDFVMDL